MPTEQQFAAISQNARMLPHAASPELKQLAEVVAQLAQLCAEQAKEIEAMKRQAGRRP